jgi:hypothetical protein
VKIQVYTMMHGQKTIKWFSFVRSISHSKKKWARNDETKVYCSSCALYSCPILMKHFLHRFFEKSSNVQFHENPSSGSRVVPCGRTDMTKLIAAFRNFAQAPKKHLENCCLPICGSVRRHQRHGGTCCFHLQSQNDHRRSMYDIHIQGKVSQHTIP